jgi:hypothetical protein
LRLENIPLRYERGLPPGGQQDETPEWNGAFRCLAGGAVALATSSAFPPERPESVGVDLNACLCG